MKPLFIALTLLLLPAFACADSFDQITLPLILSFRRGNAAERAFWNRTIVEGEIREDDLDHAISLMKKHKALEATLERARAYGDIARDALAIFPDSAHKAAMTDVIAFAINRGH